MVVGACEGNCELGCVRLVCGVVVVVVRGPGCGCAVIAGAR